MKRIVAVVVVSFVVAFVSERIRQRNRCAQTWGRVPESQWKEIAIKMKHGNAPPAMDPLQIVADVCEWLEQRG